MGIWKIHRREIKRLNFSDRAAQQLLENRSRRFFAVRGKDSSEGRFPDPGIHRRGCKERSKRGSAKATLGSLSSRSSSANLQRESEIQLRSRVPEPEARV